MLQVYYQPKNIYFYDLRSRRGLSMGNTRRSNLIQEKRRRRDVIVHATTGYLFMDKQVLKLDSSRTIKNIFEETTFLHFVMHSAQQAAHSKLFET